MDSIGRYAAHLDTQIENIHPLVPANPYVKEIYSADIRVDGEKFDIANTSWLVRRGNPIPRPSYQHRAIWDGKHFISSQQYLGKGIRQVQLVASTQPVHGNRLATNYPDAPYLRGVLTGDDQPCLRVMRDSHKAGLSKYEVIAGHRCAVLDAVTVNGTYTVWLDPQIGYLPRRIIAVRTAGDKAFGKKLPLHFVSTTQKGMRCRVGHILVKKVFGTFVIVGGVLDRTDEYAGGSEITRQTARLSNIQVNRHCSTPTA